MAFWPAFFMWIFTTVLSELLRPKPKFESAKPGGTGDFSFPTATEGRPVPWLFGTVRIPGANTVWWGDLKAEKIKETVKTGFFSSTSYTKGHKYLIGWQSVFCAGGEYPCDELVGFWIGDKKVFTGNVVDGGTFSINEPNLFGDFDEGGNGGFVGTFQFFAGSNSQAASAYLSQKIVDLAAIASGGTGYVVDDVLRADGGTFTTACTLRVTTVSAGVITGVTVVNGGIYTAVPSNPVSTTLISGGVGTGATFNLTFGSGFQVEGGDTPAYRGFCYIAPYQERIYVGNSTRIEPFAAEIRRTPNPVGVSSGHHIVNSFDANPVNVLYIALTAKDGMGFDPSTIDLPSFVTAGDTLWAEGNGFSMLIDQVEDVGDLIDRVEQQIDGVIYRDEADKKWKIALARDDYTPGTLPEINATNTREIRSFTRGSWEGTSNQVRVPFNDRDDEYKRTAALAQDMANIAIQDGVVVTAEQAHPGIKDGDLATSLAWRELRTMAYPLAQISLITDRTFHDAQPNDVLEVTFSRLSLERLPMRVQRVDRGELADGKITIDLIQDVFYAAAGTFSAPGVSGWTPPAENLVPFPVDEQFAIEAPRALVFRDPLSSSVDLDKIFAAARGQGVESSFDIRERNASGTPTGSYSQAGNVTSFALIGELASTLSAGSSVPLSSLIVSPTPDTQTAIETVFPDITDIVELGTELLTLCFIGDTSGGEFILVTSAQTNAGDVQLNNVYRGILDSVQQDHASGAKVWVLFNRSGFADTTIPPGNNVHVKFIPKSIVGELDETNASQITLDFDNRVRKPYAPSELDLNGSRFATTTSLEGSGSGEDIGIGIDFIRRSFRTAEGGDEIVALETDAATLDPNYPAEFSTEHDADVRNDPDGANTLLFNEDFASLNTGTLRRLDILQQTGGVVPTRLRVALRSSHTYMGSAYDSHADLVWDFDVTTALSGVFEFGALDTNIDSADFTVVDDSQDHDFVLSSSFTAGDVEYRINGGTWTTLIAASNTTGGIGSGLITNGDTIEVRHTSSDVGAQKLLTMSLGATLTAFAVLYV